MADDEDRLVLNELDDLIRVHGGINDEGLTFCKNLAARAYALSQRLTLDEWRQPVTLRALLGGVVEKERASNTETYSYVLAAAEFLGLRDEDVEDPPIPRSDQPKGRELSEETKELQNRIRRGARYLPPRRGRHVGTVRNANPRVRESLEVLLAAIDGFLIYRDDLDRLVADPVQFGATRSTTALTKNGLRLGLNGPDDAPTLPRNYIDRPQLEARFRSLVDDAAKLIVFVGFPGMGKTSLVRALTTGSPFIEFRNGRPNVAHLQAALERYELGDHFVNQQNAHAILAKLMCVQPGPQFVVLDNLQTTVEVQALVPPNTAATVVATCREVDDSGPLQGEVIPVDVMEPDEAKRLAKLRASSLNEVDAALLSRALGYYALMIDIACGYLNLGLNIAVRDLCRSIRVAPDDITSKASENLKVLIEKALSILRERNTAAVQILALLASTDDGFAGLDADSVLTFICDYHRNDVGLLRYADAIQALCRSFFVKLTRIRFDESVRISAHPFVRGILWGLLQEDIRQVDVTLNECMQRRLQRARHHVEQNEVAQAVELYGEINRLFHLIVRTGDATVLPAIRHPYPSMAELKIRTSHANEMGMAKILNAILEKAPGFTSMLNERFLEFHPSPQSDTAS